MSTESALPEPPFAAGSSTPASPEVVTPAVPTPPAASAPASPEPPYKADADYVPPAKSAKGKASGKTSAPSKKAFDDVKVTRTSAAWTGIIVGSLLLIVVLIFIVQNTDQVVVHFLPWELHLQLGVVLLFAVIAGALGTALVGAARIFQLWRAARKSHKAALAD